MRKTIGWLIVAALPLLGGCAAALIGGAATGVLVAQDRRTVGTVTDDKGIELKAGARVGERVNNGHINFTSFNKRVLLSGEVPTAAAREEVERITRGVENVLGVYNELQVAGNSAFTSRTNDTYLTSKVKARFVDGGKFNAVHVKVVTENSVVYLMGMVNRAESEAATEIARTTGGVQKVVRLFEYLD
ncbi:MAG TPA: BON domain-containing protein [Burkholderiales bacterium]|nr:BON domain-containing protein [Burkholderiales bacterium]